MISSGMFTPPEVINTVIEDVSDVIEINLTDGDSLYSPSGAIHAEYGSGKLLVRTDASLAPDLPISCINTNGALDFPVVNDSDYSELYYGETLIARASVDAEGEVDFQKSAYVLTLDNQNTWMEDINGAGTVLAHADLHNTIKFRVVGGDPSKSHYRIKLRSALKGDIYHTGRFALNANVAAVSYKVSEPKFDFGNVYYQCSECGDYNSGCSHIETYMNHEDVPPNHEGYSFSHHFDDNPGGDTVSFDIVTAWDEFEHLDDCFAKGDLVSISFEMYVMIIDKGETPSYVSVSDLYGRDLKLGLQVGFTEYDTSECN